MTDLILLGGGGHCKSCIDVIETNGNYSIKGILDPMLPINHQILGYEILGSDNLLHTFVGKNIGFLVTIGQIHSSDIRHKLFAMLQSLHLKTISIISPIAHISKHAQIGTGTIVMHHAIVNAGAVIGNNCIINSKALIEHDAEIGDHCHVSTGAIINGGVKVGAHSFIGSNATTRQNTTIPYNSFVKANQLVK